MHNLLLYYPNTQCAHFNWFLCGKRYHREGKDVWELSPTSTFYEPSTGKSWGIKKGEEKISLTIGKKSRKGWVEKLPTSPKNRLVCRRYLFHLPSSSLIPIEGESCRLVKFAQTYSLEIQEIVPHFPSSSEIESLVGRKGCERTCLYLYPLLVEFFNREKL